MNAKPEGPPEDAPTLGTRRRRTRATGSSARPGGLRLEVVRSLLGSYGFVTDTSGSDLFLLALGISRRASLHFERAIDVLVATGMLAPRPRERERFAHRMRQSTRDRRGFSTFHDRAAVHCEDCLDDLVTELLRSPVVAARIDRLEREAARSQAAAPAASPPPRSAPSPAERQATALAPPIADSPPPRSAPLSVTELTGSALDALVRTPRSSLADVTLALRAHDLAIAEAFEELLAPAVLMGITSHAYQLETVRRVLRGLRGRALLADEVGLGKTVEAILVLREYQLRGMARRVLVICPAALVRMWQGELLAKAGIAGRTTEDPLFAEDPARFLSEPGVVIASLSLARTSRHAASFQTAAWDLVVVDEAHHVKNRTSLGYKLVDGISSRFLLLLTATPVETDLEEIYNLITLLRPGQFATPAAFRKEFVDRSDPTSPRNRERLRELLGEVMVRNTRARSGLALPPRFVTTACVEPATEERALYDEIRGVLRRHARDGRARLAAQTLLLEAGSSVAAVTATLERIAGGDKHSAELRSDAARLAASARAAMALPSSKGERLLAILAERGGFGLVFSRFRRTQEAIAALLAARGVRHEVFHGGMTAANKHAAIERFRCDRSVLVATDVGGEGQNLQFCDLLINFDLPWNPMVIEQRIGRLHRMGQTNEVTVWNLCAKGTAEQRLLDVLDRRLNLFQLVVGEMDMVLGNVEGEDLEERILGLYAEAANDGDLDAGFEGIARELLTARTRYDGAKALDEALFGEDFEA